VCHRISTSVCGKLDGHAESHVELLHSSCRESLGEFERV
jgi:hypothetical protein